MSAAFYNYKAVNSLREFISKKILVYNPETGKHEPIDAIRGESAYEIAVRTGQTTLPEDEWIKQVQSGQIDGDFVKTVNSLHPDEKGNVKVTVNGQTADENGNIQIDVGGKVQSVNGQSPDPETGNVEIEVGNPDVITTLTRDEFNALTTAQIQKMYEDGVRTILVENEMEEGEGTYTISWDGITDKPNAYPPTQHTHGLSDEVDAAKLGGKPPEYYLSPRNLLDNSNFQIAQAGYGGLHGTVKYAADRWTLSGGTASWDGSNIVISSDADGQQVNMVQKLPNGTYKKGTIYTFAVMLADGTLGIVHGDFLTNAYANIYDTEGNRVALGIQSDNVVIPVYSTGAHKIAWSSLYEGTYTADTLPPFVSKGYAAELAECQRYFVRIGGSVYTHIGLAHAQNETQLICSVHLPQPMREGIAYSVRKGGNLNMTAKSGTTFKNISAVALNQVGVGALALTLTTEGVTQGDVFDVYVPIGSWLDISADM